MRIADLITIRDAPRPVDLPSVDTLSQAIIHEGEDLTLGTATQLHELLAEYVISDQETVDVLRVALATIARNGERGGAFMLRGSSGSGKSHLLGALALLLRHPAAWQVFCEAHPVYTDLRLKLQNKKYLVVTIPLAEHRGADEHLEDVIFDRTEKALRQLNPKLSVALSEQSHALDLIERHIIPRYETELDTYTREHVHGAITWRQLKDRSEAQAVQMARQFASEIGYPLDFRQSRVERLASLLEIVREWHLAGVVWLLDDLNGFLSGVDAKAAHGDCSFLDFIGQRSKIAPLFIVATLDEGLEQVGLLEPYLLNSIRSSFRTDLNLTTERMRAVARRRVLGRANQESYAEAISNVREAFVKAFGEVSFTDEDLTESYPLLPVAMRCLESIATRFFSSADTLVDFLSELLGETALARAYQRDFRQAIGADDVFEYLRPRIASHPEVAAYVYDVLDYYQKNAAEMFPEAPELCVRLARVLILLRLANIAAPASLLAEALSLTVDGKPVIDVALAQRALEAMRLGGSFVDVRRGSGDGPAVYVVDTHASVTETLRRRLMAAKNALANDDQRIWRHALAVCEESIFPLAQLQETRTLEVQWQNTFRCVAAQLTDVTSLTAQSLADVASDLSDPATVEDAQLYIARPPFLQAQTAAWLAMKELAPASRWAAAMLAWIPREFTSQEIDSLKEFAVIADLLEDEQAQAAEPGLGEQLMSLFSTQVVQIRRLVRDAYCTGQVFSPFSVVASSAELQAAAGSWSELLQTATARAFERIFPDFPAIAPRRPVVAREQVDVLIDQVIRPGVVALAPEDPLGELVRHFMEPLGLIVFRDNQHWIDVSRSQAAEEVMARVRQRDQTPMWQLGRPLACSDLAQHMVKSQLGLPPELFELVVGALIRVGYLAPLRDRTQVARLEDVSTPLSGSVQYVARPPLLSQAQWQTLARICRVLLDINLPVAELGAQTRIWEKMLSARVDYLEQAAALRRRLETHMAALDQRPAQWARTLEDMASLERLFQCVRPELHPAIGLQEYMADVDEWFGDPQGWQRLNSTFRHIDVVAGYLERVAEDVVELKHYLQSPELHIEPGGDLDQRRQNLLDTIAGGENLPGQELQLKRQAQTFITLYKQHYLRWHSKVYRQPLFDQYRSVGQSPEMRALHQLGKLHLKVDVTAEDMARRIDAQVARRCTRADLPESLNHAPICPDCGLLLDDEPELMPISTLMDEILSAIHQYLLALVNNPFRANLNEYIQALPSRGDLPRRLEATLALTPEASCREVLNVMTEDVIPHLNRALTGKRMAPRNLGQLRDLLEGRTISRDEARRLFDEWLNADDDDADDSLLQIDD